MEEAPITLSTPMSQDNMPNNFIKPKNTKTFNLKSDKNNEFEIEFYIFEDNLFFEGTTKKIIPQKSYKKIYSFKEVLENKYFYMCENINEVYDEIQNLINEKEEQIKLIEKTNLLILSIPLNTKKIKECIFEIDEVDVKNVNTQINDLYLHVNQILNDIKELKEKNKILEEKNTKLEEKNKILEEKNKKLEEKNKKLEEKVEEIDKLLLLPYKEKMKKEQQKEEQRKRDLNKIKEWIAPGKNITFNLLFKKSRDGDTTQDFHNHCDNKGKTLIIIETKEGRKFGGFTNDNWDTSNYWRRNSNDFVFSLDLNKKYSYSGSGDTTVGDQKYGFAFGNERTDQVDICFENNSLNKGISNSSPSFKTNKELNNGSEKFETKEIEVYQVIIN